MRVDSTGKIAENFYVLGNPHVPIYLLDGASPVLFDAGLTALSEVYVEEIRKVLKDRSPAYLCLTHSHFDHVGSASHLKAAWPEMRIVGSPKVGEVMGRPGAIALIRALNREAAE
ncbi:MAG: MBL fold metallo-hydrolase [Desulfobacterales bacterium]|nr:MBL fold metallo-hydrolase [Desulfobacterales bacterium]